METQDITGSRLNALPALSLWGKIKAWAQNIKIKFLDRVEVRDLDEERKLRDTESAIRKEASSEEKIETKVDPVKSPAYGPDNEMVSSNTMPCPYKISKRRENIEVSLPIRALDSYKRNVEEPPYKIPEFRELPIEETPRDSQQDAPGKQNSDQSGPEKKDEGLITTDDPVTKKPAKGFLSGLFSGAVMQGAAKYGVREGMSALGWLGGPAGIFATSASSAAIVTGGTVIVDYREARARIFESLKGMEETARIKEARRQTLKVIFNKDGRRKYLVTMGKSFAGALVGGGMVAGISELLYNDAVTEQAKGLFAKAKDFLTEKFYSVFPELEPKTAAIIGAAGEGSTDEVVETSQIGSHGATETLKVVEKAPKVIPSLEPEAIHEVKEPFIMPILNDLGTFAGEDGLEAATVEKMTEAQNGNVEAIMTLADHFANGTGGIKQDNGIAKILCGEAEILGGVSVECPEGDLTEEHDILFEEQMKSEDEEIAAFDARLAEMDREIEEIRFTNDQNITELKMHIMGINEASEGLEKTIQRIEEILGDPVSELAPEPPSAELEEICVTTENEDGTITQDCENSKRKVGDEYVLELTQPEI